MPRLTPLARHEVSEEVARYYDADVERYGTVLNNTMLYAYNAPVLRALKELSGAFTQLTAVPVALKALIRVRVAGLNGCPF